MDQPFPRPDAPAITRPANPEPPPLGGRKPDPGSRLGALIGGILAFVLILSVAVIQQSGFSALKSTAQPPAASSTDIAPPPVLFDVMARIYVKLNAVDAPVGGQGGGKTAILAESAVPELDDMGDEPEQKVRVAIVAAEFGRVDDAIKRLTDARAGLSEDSPLAEDADDLIELYRPPEEGVARPELDPADVARLIEHHDWFGRLASTYGKPMTDPERQEVAGGGQTLVLVLALFGLWIVVALFSGLVLLIIGVVKAASGTLKARFVPPAPGGSVAIETVAVFAAGFILLKFVTELAGAFAGKAYADAALYFSLSAEWLLALAILWPVVRGVKVRDNLALFGLHRGRGVFREIGCGFLGYLACLPLFGLGVLITLVLVAIQAMIEKAMGQKPEPPDNGIVDLVGRGGHPGVLVLLFCLATMWAPLVEESIFRGALYRQLRTRWGWFPCAIVTALAFGMMHSYAVPLLFPVIMLGFGFCLLREWRGSIIASMTGHFLHNATALSAMLIVSRLLGL